GCSITPSSSQPPCGTFVRPQRWSRPEGGAPPRDPPPGAACRPAAHLCPVATPVAECPPSGMNLAVKLTLALVAGIAATMALYACVQVRSETILLAADAPRADRGTALRAAVQSMWRSDGRERALAMVDAVARDVVDADVRWLAMPALRADGARLRLSPP